MSVLLIQTDSPITREARNSVNENWKRISEGFLKMQLQINFLGGGTDVEDLIKRIEAILIKAEVTDAEINELMKEAEGKLTEIQNAINASVIATNVANEAIDKANTAISEANTATANTTQAIVDAQTATANANTATTDAQTATANANTATTDAQTATANANQAVTDTQAAITATNLAADLAEKAAQAAVNEIATMIQTTYQALKDIGDMMATFEHKGTYDNLTQYKMNNEVLYMGSTFRAKADVIGTAPPNDYTSSAEWQLIARRGDDAVRPDDLAKVWRGVNPPEDIRAIWWYDPDAEEDEYVFIKMGEIPPTDTRNLWLAPREEN